jgi:type I restriction enzyme S subunit
MSFGRIDIAIGDVCEVKQGRYLPPEQMSTVGTELSTVPVYGANGILGYTDQAAYQEPVTLITCRGSYCGKIQRTSSKAWISNNAMACRPTKHVDSRYLHYVLLDTEFRDVVTGSAQPQITLGNLRPKRITITESVDEQQSIAATLGALDEKIESNGLSVGILEETLRVRFLMLKTTESIEAIPLAEVADITKGVSYKSADLQPSVTSLVTLKSFDRTGGYKVEGLKPYTGKYKPEQVITPGEIVIAQTDLTQGAEVVGRAVRVPSDSSADALVASLDLVIIRPRTLSREYLLGVVTDEVFRQHCRSRVNGTTVLHLASDAIPTYEAPVAAPEVVSEFTDLARPILELIDSLNRESKKLVSLRDALLPELLSGRIRVPEAEEAVAEVVE